MIKIRIGEPQENGIYGMPMTAISYENNIGINKENEFIKSACIAAIGEWYFPNKFELYENSFDYITFKVYSSVYSGLNTIYYDNSFVKDNVFYYFENTKEKKEFYRKLKLDKLMIK